MSDPTPSPRRPDRRTSGRPQRTLAVGALVGAIALVAGCGTSDQTAVLDLDVAVVARADSDTTFGWQEFGDERVQVGSLEVPVDPTDPALGTFDLYVARHLADPERRVGSLLINPGGPGVAGSDFAVYADQVFSPTLVAHFDIIGWDPRGVGLSEPAIDCVDDYDRFYAGIDITPEDETERTVAIELAEEFQQGCIARSAAFLPHVGTNDSAADIDRIRDALGEETISYFGFSYGSELGGAWATLFPETVRAAVLDGAVDPTADGDEASLQQAVGFERSLDAFFEWCDANDDCDFRSIGGDGGDGGDGGAAAAFDVLMASVDLAPLPTAEGRPLLDLGVFNNGVVTALYSDELWPDLAEALADAQAGDGRGLLALHDSYFDRRDDGTWDNTLEAFQVIQCMDDPQRETPDEAQAQLDEIRAQAPRVVPGTVAWPSCAAFPAPDEARVPITGAGAGPIVVVGTTGDSATPLAGTRRMAGALEEGLLVVVEADQHTGYGANDCVTDAIDAYLVAGTLPVDGLTCG